MLKRIAVSRPGHGFCKQLLRAVVGRVLQETDAHGFWLGVFPVRARRAYKSVGFVTEGVVGGSALFGGVHRDELIMAILRTDEAKIANKDGSGRNIPVLPMFASDYCRGGIARQAPSTQPHG